MTAADLTDFLIADAQASDPVDLTFINGLLTNAKAKISGGKGEVAPLTQGQVGGKQWMREIKLSALEVASACRSALDFLQEDSRSVSATRFDFGGLNDFGGCR
jgi:hypothetical protein